MRYEKHRRLTRINRIYIRIISLSFFRFSELGRMETQVKRQCDVNTGIT